MRIEFNRTGAERKELVQTLAAILEEETEYLGAPSMAYRVGKFTVTRDGALEYDDFDFPEGIDQIVQDLERSDIEPVKTEEPSETEEEPSETAEETEGDSLSVSMAREFFTGDGIENLKKLVESKGALIKKALGTDDLPIEVTDEKVTFPWFKNTDAGDAKAYTIFVAALSKMAVTQTRITAKEKEVDNEKYAFRCFLLRLGFIGDEYKAARKVLLKNLTGSSAFKSGQKGGTA